MISAVSTVAKQANRSASTGSCTAEGKSISRRNSLKHARPIRSMTSTRVVMSYESRQEYDELSASMQANYRPATPQEILELGQVTQHYWRLERCRRMDEHQRRQRPLNLLSLNLLSRRRRSLQQISPL
jgi:hypothetical protein